MSTYRRSSNTLAGVFILAAIFTVFTLLFAWPAEGDTGYTPASTTTCWLSRFLGRQQLGVFNPDAHPWGLPPLAYPEVRPGGYSPEMHTKRYGFDGSKRGWCVTGASGELFYKTVEALQALCRRGQWGAGHDCIATWEEATDAVASREAPGLIRLAGTVEPPPCCECSTGRLFNRLVSTPELGEGVE